MTNKARAVAVVSATLITGVLLAGATPPTPPSSTKKHPPKTARGHENQRAVDNDLVVSDPLQPRLLHSKRPGVVDKAWIAATARPAFAPGLLDALDDLAPATGDRHLQSPEAPPLASAAIRLAGDVFVIEGDAQVVVKAGDLDPRVCPGNADFPNANAFNHANGSDRVLISVLQSLGDNYDFVSVFTTFDDPCTAAYYFPLKQDTDGLGNCDFPVDTFGCLFNQLEGTGIEQLQGFVFMNSLNTWRESDLGYDGVTHPLDDFQFGVYSTLGQEVAHRWGSALRFVDPRNDRVSDLLLGRDRSHWAAYADTDASVMDGWDWSDDGEGRFDLLGDMERYSTLDLYTMGALPVAAAKPFFVIDDAVFDVTGDQFGVDGRRIPADVVLQMPSVALMDQIGMKVRAIGESVPVTIQAVADAEGNRCPDPGATQKTFRQAVVLVTPPGVSATPGQIADLETVMATWEAWWLDRTNKTLRLCTALEGDCEHAQMEIVGGVLDHGGDSIQPGESGKLKITVKNTGTRAVDNAVVTFDVIGDSKDFTTVAASADLGSIAVGEEASVDVDVAYDDTYPCGVSSLIRATVSADNAADVVEEIRTFPGLKTLKEETFASEDHPFGVNADEKDGTVDGDKGALRYTENVELTCDMTQRSVERDASPGDRGAFVTGPGTDHVPNLLDDDAGAGAELDGDTSLWSPKFDLKDTRDPEVRFAYWFDGEGGDVLKVQISGDGEKTFVTTKEVTDSFHGWVIGRVSVRDVFEELPESVTLRFVFEGNGQLEGGIDDVRLLDYDGVCLESARGGGFCGCDASGEATPVAPIAGVVALLALRRRRRRTNAGGIDGDSSPVL